MKITGLKSLSTKKRRVARGFTLVELVIVLILISILAAVGIASAIGYIKHSKFNKNEQNAITIYQTSQTAMSQMVSAGSMDSWVRSLIDDTTIGHITALAPVDDPAANESVGKTVHLTYNPTMPNSESKAVYDLLTKYFYDKAIFTGTISIEFYISMTYDANNVPYYSARVISAFFSNENTADEGWDETCLDGSTDGLPNRDVERRYSTTLVGYYDGSEASTKPQVVSVFLPRSQMYVMDGHIIGPTDDPNATASNYLFNIRNGETLDISWALFDDDGQLHTDHDENLTIKLVTPNDGQHGNSNAYGDVVINVTAEDIKTVNFVSDGTKVFESIGNYVIERESASGLITLNVQVAGQTKTLQFPITRTVVSNDGRTGCPKDPTVGTGESPAKYYEYRLSIDCMMVRSDESLDESYRYNIKRLFGDTPRNFYATIEGSFKVYKLGSDTPELKSIPLTYAARAIDDPVFFVDVGKTQGGQTAYFYKVDSSLAAYDVDDTIDSDTGEFITGTCFVNTLFGDYNYSNDYAGTNWTTEGGDAVITSFRHLYNIRNVNTSYISNFRIVCDLNWYVDKSGLRYVSEVRVYTYNNNTLKYSMPASNSMIVNETYTVPFPAFNTLYSNQTLDAMTSRNGTVYSINNLPLRKSSFKIGTDSAYGLFCKNLGKIGNLKTNNFSLVMATVNDKTDDKTKISVEKISVSSQESGAGNLNDGDNRPIGGLVGINAGEVGQENSTIVMSNSIVMANEYWKYYDKSNKTATGGIIGQNDNRVLGSVEINGSFAVVGRDCVGGVIGKSTADIEAKLLVNSSNAPEGRYTLPYYSCNKDGKTFTTQNLSCVIICKSNGGGAIGLIDGAELKYEVDNPFTTSNNPENGVFSAISDDDYQVDVNLPENSLVLSVGGYNNLKLDASEYCSVGGAIGYMRSCGGTNASIRVNNSGNIIVLDKDYHVYCGGAVGREYNCTTQNVFINVNNGSGRIGYIDNSTGTVATGGAIGQINCSADGRTISINAVNNGTIVARGDKAGQGAGGAIGGALYGTDITFLINVENNNNSLIMGTTDNEDKNSGVGGAIGCVGNIDSEFSAKTVIYSENQGSIDGKHNVGGAVGFAPINRGKIYSVNSGTITGSQHYVGGAVGRLTYDHYGVIQAVLESSCEISGYRYVGGAAGRLTRFHDGATAITIVRGSSSVIGKGSLIGGICGDIRLVETGSDSTIKLIGDSSEPVLTVEGNDGVGGAIGILRSENVISAEINTPNQSSTNKLVIHVEGANKIGGVIGCLKESTNAIEDKDMNNLLGTNGVLLQDNMVTITAKLNPKSYVIGTGNNVGGAVGYFVGKFDNGNYSTFSGIIDVSTSSGSTSGSAYIRGNKFVGGAVGHIESVVPSHANNTDGYIKADFSAATWDIEATVASGNEADVGGAIGYFQGATDKKYGVNDSTYLILVNLGPSNVTAGGYNVGGAIGKNQIRAGIINVSGIGGTVSGEFNVGGAIGCNLYQAYQINVTVNYGGTIRATGSCPSGVYPQDKSTINSNTVAHDGIRKADGSNVGGAIGYYNFSSNDTAAVTSKINVTINGTITGPGNNVGGAIGFCYSNRKSHLIRDIVAVLQGSAVVQGADNVGGANGFSLSNITNVQTNISGKSQVIGNYHVAGAIGWTYATANASGDDVYYQKSDISKYTLSKIETELTSTLYKSSGRIASITATISADFALQGTMYIGGAVGQSGYKSVKGGNFWVSPSLISVVSEINTGYLFNPHKTGEAGGNASVGGVIGLVVDGRVEAVRLNGTGGTVNTDASYNCPEISESGAVLIAASGKSVGGIIGQIGLESTTEENLTGSNAQKVTVSNISAADDLHLCVVSMDDSDRVGGWIGSAFGKFGGLGNRTSGDFGNASKRAIYNVNNVRYVYSQGDYVGGFCGYSRGYGARETYLVVNINLKNATVTGRNGVGGAFGLVYAVNFKSGSINVNLSDHSLIGDNKDNSLCQEAGGAIGSLNLDKSNEGNDAVLSIPITVNIDDTSNICSKGGDTETSEFGVGGVLGEVKNGKLDKNGTLRINATNANSVSVYSRYSNVGGVVGVMNNVSMSAYTSDIRSYAVNVSVCADGENACVGGFAGRINSLSADMYYCYCYGDVSVKANGTNACAGGFVGYAAHGNDDRKIENCYTTAVVTSSGAYTGGFVGRMLRGKISHCYVGGHTYQGSYVSGEGNVTGVGSVGGFVGATTGTNKVTFTNCYSTASVLGTANDIGGFIGNASNKTYIDNCYCTGKVICPDTLTSGAFAGNIGNVAPGNFTSNKAMLFVNDGNFPLFGKSCTSAITAGNIDYAENKDIRGKNNDIAHPFDLSLPSKYYDLRAVIGTDHYGDWPLPSSGTTIDDAEVQIYVQTGVDEQGNPLYGWVVFENNKYEYLFNGTTVTIDPANLKVLIQGVPLERDTDYVIFYRDNSKVGTATITFAAKSGSTYSGAISKTFKITATDVEGINAVFNEQSHEYTGARIIPGVTVTYNEAKLVYGTDYTLAYDRDGNIEEGYDNDNINIGVMSVYVIGKGNYSGTKLIGQYEITPIDLSKLEMVNIDLIGADNLVYDENEDGPVKHCPNVAVRYNGQTLNGTTDTEADGFDYVISYEDNDKAGTAYLVITGTADASIGTGKVYIGSKRVPFTISPAVNTWTSDPAIEGWIYGDTPNAPTGSVKFGEIDYKFFLDANCNNPVEDISAVDIGRYYVQVFATDSTESGNFTGPTPVILSFTISPKDISEASVSIARNEYPYNNGSPIEIDKSSITVTIGSGESAYDLDQDDFTIASYDPAGHSEPGVVTVTVAGAGNYKGTATGTFTIYREYQVKFLSIGQVVELKSVREGSTVSDPGEPAIRPASENYRFDGWYTDYLYTEKFDFTQPITEDVSPTANWIRYSNVTFDTGDPDVVIDGENPQKVDWGNYVVRPEDPVRPGYKFVAWCDDNGEYKFNLKIYGDVTLTAQWIPEYNVSFFTGEGTTIDSQLVVEDGFVEVPALPPEWEGHDFKGWYKDEECTTEYDFTEPVKNSFTLYAKWEDIPPEGG